MSTTYTEKELVVMLTKERERCIKIAEDFMRKYERKASEYDPSDVNLIHVAKREGEVARKILISMDGRLLGSISKPMEEQIKRDYFLDNEILDSDM